MYKKILFIFLTFLSSYQFLSQTQQEKNHFHRADTLKGGLRPERTDFDILKYNLEVEVFPEEKFISGKNEISFKTLKKTNRMQLDLFENMKVDSILYKDKKLVYQREFDAVFIDFPQVLSENTSTSIDFYFSGKPTLAKNPPWDGGFIFTKDKNGKDWISLAVQGIGASAWYPNKDHPSDRPEEAEIHVTTPKDLMNVSNGRLTKKEELTNGKTLWSWKVTYPINSYNLIINIGDYVHFSDTYQDLDLEYYVLSYNKEKAQEHFEQVKPMMSCFTEKFGAYPFKRDSYKLVEAPFLGMEHQSAVAYGNHFKNGYAGRDISGSGVGLKFDFMIVHESAHEWFGNSISASDKADMWIQEGFTSYAEAVYIECRWGKTEALKYLNGLRRTMVENLKPIIGNYNVNQKGSTDMYYKSANMLHTIRTIIDNDQKWWKILKDFYKKYEYQIIDTEEVVEFFTKESDINLNPVFEQYLKFTRIPELQFKRDKGKVYYRWEADAVNFEMPVNIGIAGKPKKIYATKYWQELDQKASLNQIKADEINNYIQVRIFK